MAAMAAAKRLGAQSAQGCQLCKFRGCCHWGYRSRGRVWRSPSLPRRWFLRRLRKKHPPGRALAGQDLPEADKKALLAYARKTITWFLNTQTVPLARGILRGSREQPQGCIRHSEETSRSAGLHRPDRPGCSNAFEPPCGCPWPCSRPLTTPASPLCPLGEMKDIEIELSVLTPIKSVSGPGDIVVGRDGVILGERKQKCCLPAAGGSGTGMDAG